MANELGFQENPFHTYIIIVIIVISATIISMQFLQLRGCPSAILAVGALLGDDDRFLRCLQHCRIWRVPRRLLASFVAVARIVGHIG